MVEAYGSIAYSRTLPHIGIPIDLPLSGGCVLRRVIPGTDKVDLVGPYPWAEFDDWASLADDLARLPEEADSPVSMVAVISPTSDAKTDDLARAFPDHLVEFKQHYLVDLTVDYRTRFRSSHRRKVRRASSLVNIRFNPSDFDVAWSDLYAQLATRHRISGPADFPADALKDQLALPNLVVCSGWSETSVLGAITFLVNDRVATYHLGAFSAEGYAQEAAFALFPAAFEHLTSLGVDVVNLGGGAGVSVDRLDGLAQFKRGWASLSAPSQIGGRIFDRATYRTLAGGKSSGFFPSYRATEAA